MSLTIVVLTSTTCSDKWIHGSLGVPGHEGAVHGDGGHAERLQRHRDAADSQ